MPHDRPWHARPAAELPAALATDFERGLPPAEAAARLARAGRNEVAVGHPEPWWEAALEALTEPLVLLLLATALLYALLGELGDALTIFAVILAVAAAEVVNETRAKRAIASLRVLGAPSATVVRGGAPAALPAAEVVPGDLVLLAPGDRVPADLRLVEAVALRVDESSLTGESAPAAKEADVVLPPETEPGDRRNLAFAGTVVTAGKGLGVAVATGRDTELGRLAGLAAAIREPRTPLEQHLRQLAGWLTWLALGLSALIPLLGLFVARRPLREMLLTGLTLAFATIPEELPILVTIVLALGAYRLARQQAVVKRLRVAETLGSVSVVGTDKTGTLTENRMQVVELFADGATQAPARAPRDDGSAPPVMAGATARLLAIGVLASDAPTGAADGRAPLAGDPTESALLAAAAGAGLDVAGLRAGVRVLAAHPFDDARRRASVAYERDGARWLAVKGAPEPLLAACTHVLSRDSPEPLDAARRRQLEAAVDEMAARGLRVLAFAERQLVPGESLDPGSVEAGLTVIGLAGLEDPPRPEAPGAVAALQGAGVRVLMLTGDHAGTARNVAARVGIDGRRVVLGREVAQADDEGLRRLVAEASVFARIAPEDKLRIVRALTAQGEVVAVTGDGVNDAPALREAAIGIAMGRGGTEAAREAADLVLADDNFATVAAAVRAGRTLYANLAKGVRYYLAAKVALVASSLAAVLAGLPVPFTPVQIILLELFMDLGASTTFVAEPPEGDVMSRPPRDPQRPFMDRAMQVGIVAGGLSLAAAVLVAYGWTWGRGLGLEAARTAAFAAWMVGHLALAAHVRAEQQPLRVADLGSNGPFLAWAAGALGLLALAMVLPPLRVRLHLAPLDPAAWAVALGAGLLFPSWWEIAKRVRGRGLA